FVAKSNYKNNPNLSSISVYLFFVCPKYILESLRNQNPQDVESFDKRNDGIVISVFLVF
ncbi:unnamed protein product, partial [Arabidopsis halleri]